MQPKILFLDHAAVLSGAELYLLDLARHFRGDARVVLFEDGPFRERLQADGVDVRIVAASASLMRVERQSGWQRALTALPALARQVTRIARMAHGFDVVYANSQKAFVIGALAGTLAQRPVVWNLHDILTADHFSALNRRLVVACANHLATRVVVNSEATRRAFAQSGGRVEKTGIVYNGIDAALFDEVERGGLPAFRSSLGIPQDAPVAGIFSRLAPWKGQHVLLEALPTLPGLHALLVGGALFEPDRAYERRLHETAEHLGVADRVHFLGFRDDVPHLMKLADFVVHTSTAAEPFGRVIVEGMLAERPVVATRAGGALEIVDDGTTGRLVSPSDPRALAQALQALLDAPEEAAAMAQAGRRAARQRFSKTQMLRSAETEIRRALGAA